MKWKAEKVSSSLKIRAKLDKEMKVKKQHEWQNHFCGCVKQVPLFMGVM